MVALPVSGIDVTLRRPAGEDDILLCEAPRQDMGLSVALLSRLTGARCQELPVGDVEMLLLELRRLMFGDVVSSDTRCPQCGATVDVQFRISDYIAHHAPRPSDDVGPSDQEGWLSLAGAPVLFRVPLASDQIAVGGRTGAEQLMIARCVRPAGLPPRALGRVSRALQRLAPPLGDLVQGRCPECGAEIVVDFDPQEFALTELRLEAALVYDEIHLLASHYGWSEKDILALPGVRRRRYAELIREGGH